MSDYNKGDYISYRLAKADEALHASDILIDSEQWNASINRLYYASFYAVTALLAGDEILTKSHSGVKTQFFLNYIKPNLIDRDLGKLYSDLFDWRQKGDYGDFFDFEDETVEPLYPEVKRLIADIKHIIDNKKEG